MEICFNLTANDFQALIDETIAARMQRDEPLLSAVSQWQKRYRTHIAIGLAVLCAALAPWLIYGHYTAESMIALALGIPLALIICRRLPAGVLGRSQKQHQADSAVSLALLQRCLHWHMARARDRFIGLHTWHIGSDTLRIVLPNGQQAEATWNRIVYVSHTPSFYRLTNRLHRLTGLAYVLPKHSDEMEDDVYQQGISMILQRTMAGVPGSQI